MNAKTKNLVYGKYSFEDLVDIEKLRNLFDLFSQSTGFTTGLVSFPDQKLLVGTGWHDICVKFHRVFPESEKHCKSSNLDLTSRLMEGKELNIHHCELGLVDGATPIIIKGVQVASLFTGQILFEKPDFAKFRKQGEIYGYNVEEYIEALKKVPVVTEYKFKETLGFLAEIAIMLAEQGLMGLQIIEANKALQVNETHMRTLIETIPDLFWLKDADGIYLRCNPKFEQLYNTKEKNIIGKTDYDFVEKKIAESFREQDKNAIAANKTIINEEEVKYAADGHTEIIETAKTPMYSQEGELIGVLGVARDITERKIVAEELKTSEERYRNMIEGLFWGIIIHVDDKIVFANKAVSTLLGYSSEHDFTGTSIFEYIHPEEHQKIIEAINRSMKNVNAAENDTPFIVEQRLIKKDGSELIVETSPVNINYDGKPALMVMIVDITERKKAEESQKTSEKKYRELFALMRLMSDTMPDLLWAKDLNNQYIFTNKAICSKLLQAKDTSEPIGKTDIFFAKRERNSHPDNPQWHTFGELCTDSDGITLKEMKQMQFDEYGNVKGKFLYLDVHKAPLLNNEGELIGVVGTARDITERKKAEEKLKNSEEKYRVIFNHAPIGIITFDTKGNPITMNDQVLKILGSPSKEATMQINILTFAGLKEVGFSDDFIKCLETKTSVRNENYYISKWNRKTYIRYIFTPIIDDENIVTGIQAIFEDFTKRKHAEEKLSKLSLATEQSPASVVISNLAGEIEYVNPKFTEITGYSYNEVINQNSSLLKSGEQPTAFYKELWNTITSGNNWSGEFHNKKKNGELFWESAIISPIKDNSEKITHFVAVKEDITERKKIAEEIKESESKYRVLAENSVDFIWKVDMQLNMLYASPGVFPILGYSQDEALKMNAIDFFTQDEYLKILQVIKQELNLGLKHKGNRFESVAIHKNGNTFPVEVTGKAIFNENGDPVAISGYTKNITERKLAENELLISKEKVENASKMKDVFLAQMSHEIRTPINALVSMASLLRYDFEEEADEDQIMSFDVIDRAGGRIIRTVDLLLNLSEIQAGTYEVATTQFDIVSDVLSILIAEYKKPATKKKIKLKLESNMVDTELVADSYTVNQIFTQLIDNAIKYTAEGVVTIKILRNDLYQLVVEIKDTGIGIDEEYLPHLFEPFTQEEMGYTRKYEGNGIGMALVHKYCELNNANIEVESEKGVGSTFRVIFD